MLFWYDGFMYYVYLARCSDRSLYTGYTNDLDKREQKHNDGEGAKYTRSRRPVKMVYFEEFEDRSGAMRREAQIKKWRKEKKENLIKLQSEAMKREAQIKKLRRKQKEELIAHQVKK